MNIFQRQRKLKIATKVAISFFAIVILQGTMTQLGMSVLITDSNAESFKKQMDNIVESAEAYFSQTILDLKNKVELLAGQQNIISFTEFRLINLLNRELVLFNAPLNLDGIYVFLEDGLLIGSDGTAIRTDSVLKNEVRNAFKQGSNFFVIQNGSTVHFWSLSQIVSNEKVIAMLGSRIAIDRTFLDSIEQISGALAVIRYNDQIITSSNIAPDQMEEILAVISKVTADANISQGDFLYGSQSLESHGFPGSSMISILDIRSSRGLVERYNQLAIFLSFMVLIIASVLSILFYRQSFLRPYQTLQEGVARIGDGDFSYPIHHTSADEFGDLVESVDRMRLSLLTRDRELNELVRYNELILNNVPSGIITISEDGHIDAWNRAAQKMFGYSSDAELELPLNIDEAGLPSAIIEMIELGLQVQNYVTLQEFRTSIRGKQEILSVTTAPFSDSEGKKLGLIVVIADVTLMKKLEEELSISQRLAAIGEMVAGVAHQLRNPMAIMKVSAEMLRDNFQNGKQYGQLTSMLVSEIDSLNYIIDNFLDFARPIHTSLAPCDPKDLINASLALLPLRQFPNNKVIIEIDKDIGTVTIDKDLMEQVVSNLVLNALEASRDSDVSVRAFKRNNALYLVIEDQGMGMDNETVQNIFNPFFTKKTSGTGLGLSIVHRIIQEHKGRIDVKSKPGKGSTFTVII